MTLRIAFLTAEWRDLVIANFDVEPARLAPLVPAGTELDLFEDRALVSLVGFRFLRTRVLGVPVPWHMNFEEVNLRFYVKRRGPDGTWRRAVTFIREIVPRRAIALTAKWIYGEPYAAAPMRHRIELDDAVPRRAACAAAGARRMPHAGGSTTAANANTAAHKGTGHQLRRAEYSWRLGRRWHTIGAGVHGAPQLPAPGSEAAFTVEHYWGYTALRDGSTREYEVAHPTWRVWHADEVRDVTLDLDPGVVYGAAWADLLEHPPTAVVVAEGSPVKVLPPRRLRPAGEVHVERAQQYDSPA